jgi:Gpi18-like mannosyltransferase
MSANNLFPQIKKVANAGWFVRLRQDRSIRDASFVFILTRSLIFFIFVCVGHLNVTTIPDQPTNVREPSVSLEGVSIARQLRKTMWRADVAHYMVLAHEGYLKAPFDIENARSRQFVFFPLHPLLLWLLGHITSDLMLGGAALSNIFFFFALIFLHKLTLSFGYDESVARRTIFYIAAFPVSYFFSVPLTESLFLLLTVASFYAAKREKWWVAGVIGALASASRVNGVLLLPALVLLSFEMYRSLRIRKILGLLLVPVGLFAFMIYSKVLCGSALAFRIAEERWGRRPSFFLTALVKYLIHPHQIMESWNLNLLNAASALLCFFCVYLLIRRREWALAFYTFMSIFLPLSTGLLQSLDRYTVAFFPVFMALAIAARSYNVDQTIRFIFVILLGIMSALFAANYTVAVA